MALRDSTLENAAKDAIAEIASDGYARFGISKPFFLTNLVNSLSQDGKYDEALSLVGEQIGQTQDEAFLYGLRAYVNDRKGDETAALADYRKAASMANADAELLVRAARKIYNAGTVIWNSIDNNNPEKRQDVKVNYFEAAKAIAEKAKELDPQNTDADNILENIDYALGAYF